MPASSAEKLITEAGAEDGETPDVRNQSKENPKQASNV